MLRKKHLLGEPQASAPGVKSDANAKLLALTLTARHHRRGSVYVAVVGVSLIIAIVGLTAMHLERVELRAIQSANDINVAQQAAQSALEIALQRIQLSDSDWRDNYMSGEEVPSETWFSLGANCRYKFVVSDPDDGDLTDDSSDPVTVEGIGSVGGAVSVVAGTYLPTGKGISCLESALHCQGAIFIQFSSIGGSGVISSSDSINHSFSTVNLEQQIGDRNMPDPATIFDLYSNRLNATPLQLNNFSIDRYVLTSSYNPFGNGATSDRGIYVVDCGGEDLVIRDSRIQATLIVRDVREVRLEKSINWEPAIPNYPCLLVEGDIRMDWEGDIRLDESNLGVHFNPLSAFPDSGDTDLDDDYPSSLKGVIYCSGNLSLRTQPNVNGSIVVGGSCNTWSANVTLNYELELMSNAPPGFAAGENLQLIPGSWSRSEYDKE